jgi:hypothetical protein
VELNDTRIVTAVIASISWWIFPQGGGSAGVQAVPSFEHVSVNNSGEGANDLSLGVDITSDGNKVAFFSGATNLAKGGGGQAFLRNRMAGRTIVVSRSSSGAIPKLGSTFVRISPNGRFVSFCTTDPNVVKPDRFMQIFPPPVEDRYMDLFVRDLERRITRRVSTSFRGGMANGYSCGHRMANDGDIVFVSKASNLVRGDTNKEQDVFYYDWGRDQVHRVSVSSSGQQADGKTDVPGLSADSRVVVFHGFTDNLTRDDPPSGPHLFVHLPDSGRTIRLPEPEGVGDGLCFFGGNKHLSREGRFILFSCWPSHPPPPGEGGIGSAQHLYLYDRITKIHKRVTPVSLHEQYGGPVSGWDLSHDARYVSWCTSNVYSDDYRNHSYDLFVRDMWSGTIRRIYAEPDYGLGHQCASALTRSAVAFLTDRPFSPVDTNDTLDVYLTKL